MTRTRTTFSLGLGLALMIGSAGGAQGAESRGKAGLGEIRKVSALLDTDLMNFANERIAEVEDVVMSPQGEFLYAIVGYGGLAGVGEKSTAVPWDLLNPRFVDGKWAANLDLTEDALKRAPTFQNRDDRDLTNPQWVARIRRFFEGRSGQAVQPGSEPGDKARRAVRYVLRASKIIDAPLSGANNEKIGNVTTRTTARSRPRSP